MRCVASRLKSLLLIPVSAGFIFVASLGVDRILPAFAAIPPQARGFDPVNGSNRIEHVKSCDFECVARINSLGLRGPEISLNKGDRYRIAVIGSSYVYGWGVNDDECWVRLLEKHLREAGINAEVINLGRNGGNVGQYRSLAYEAIPLLRPDMVIVVLGQGCDISWTGTIPRSEQVRLLLKRLYPNVMALYKGPRTSPPPVPMEQQAVPPLDDSAKEPTRQKARSMYAEFTPAEKARFDQLDQRVKDVFYAGDVNPGVIFMAIKSTTMYSAPLDPNNDGTRTSTGYLAQYLRDIKRVAGKYGADMMVLSMPFGAYVNEAAFRNYCRVGFAAVEGMPSTSKPDEPFQRACDEAGLPLVTVTDVFRRQGNNPHLFFEMDLHLARDGQTLFVESILPRVLDRIRSARQGGT